MSTSAQVQKGIIVSLDAKNKPELRNFEITVTSYLQYFATSLTNHSNALVIAEILWGTLISR